MELSLKEEDIKPKKRPVSFLKRLSSNVSLLSWLGDGEDDEAPTTKGATEMKLLSRADRPSTQHQQGRQPRPATFGSTGFIAPWWTPPLSPSSKSARHSSSSSFSVGDSENRAVLSPRGALKMLNSPGVPPLDDLRQMRTLVGAASRAWLRDFLIRGGRRCVNAKVSEMAALEKEAKKRARRLPLMPRVFGRKNSNYDDSGNRSGSVDGRGKCSFGLVRRPTLREIAEAREELMKLVVFLHLRE